MRKNTLFVSILLGIGAGAALFTVWNNTEESKYASRATNKEVKSARFNSEYLNSIRANVNTGKVEAADYNRAIKELDQIKRKSGSIGLGWEFAGPENIGGRSRAIVVDKDDDQLLYAGGAGGGLYISKDAGGTWEYKSESWSNIHISTIVQDADGRLYAGTGFYADASAAAANYVAFPGGGIWTSSDRGETWTHLASTDLDSPSTSNDQWSYINRLAVSKVKNSAGNYTLYAGTRRGLMVSADKGATWTRPMTIPNCVNPLPGNVQDVVTLSSGRVLVSYNGELYVSDDGEVVCSYNKITEGIGGSSRMSLTACLNDENIVYAFQASGSSPNYNFNVLKSTDAGNTWLPNAPAPPSVVIDSTFDLFGVNPVAFNQAITVDPTDCDRLYIGAVSMYRVDGAWDAVASNFGQGPFYVHSDKHQFVFDPHNPQTMYVASDGGIGKTTNARDGVVTWTENNRNMGTTQYYGIAFSREGHIIGGTQDNGTHLIDPTFGGPFANDAVSILGGDGFDCEVSDIGDIGFATIYYSQVNRVRYRNGGGNIGEIHPQVEGSAPFTTVIRLWESENDLTSKDSAFFRNDTISQNIGASDGIKLLFNGTLVPVHYGVTQPSAKLKPGSTIITYPGISQDITDASTPGVLRSGADSVGWVDYNDGSYELRFKVSPPKNMNPKVNFNVTYNAGDVIKVVSRNQNVIFDHTLASNLPSADSVLVQNKIQSLLAMSLFGGVRFTRDAIDESIVPEWFDVSVSGTPYCMEWSMDGNHLFVGTNQGNVVRISGFNNVYQSGDVASLQKTTIFNGNGIVSGINLHPTDEENLLISIGGYGLPDHVFVHENATSATGSIPTQVRNVQGNLPDFPVYDVEYNVNNLDQVLLGTELGVWATSDFNSASPTWVQESNGIGNVPVHDIRQERAAFNQSPKYGVFYIGTFGRGIWTTSDLVSVNEDDKWGFSGEEELNTLNVYPNPVSNVANFEMNLSEDALVTIQVFTINGTLVESRKVGMTGGVTNYELNTSGLPNGTYFATVQTGNSVKKAKFVVLK